MGSKTELVFHLSGEMSPFPSRVTALVAAELMITTLTCQTLHWRCTRILKNL